MRALFAVAAFLLMASGVHAQEQERLSYPSATYDTLVKMLKGEATEQITAEGVLMLPEGGGKLPAVVLLHTIGGRSDTNETWLAKRLVEAGYAAFLPDSFTPRGWRDVATKGGAILAASQTADAFNALKLLASHPRIDAGRVAVIGFSLGGDSAHFTAFEPLRRRMLPDGLRFAAHVPFYPAASWGIVPGPQSYTGAPVRFELAENEDAGPVAKLVPYLESARQAGAPVEWVIHPGAYHGWTEERFIPTKFQPNHAAPKNCSLLLLNPGAPAQEMTAAGEVRPVDMDAWRDCLKGSRGYTMGYDSSVRRRSVEDLLDFLKRAM